MLFTPTRGSRDGLLALLLAIGLLLGLAACGAGGGSGATGTISGDVIASPTCPVERTSTPCQKPVPDRQVTIETASGATAASTKTDANGHFSVAIAPGKYVVHVLVGSGMLGIRQVTPGDVTVTANQTSTIHIVLDTGIR